MAFAYISRRPRPALRRVRDGGIRGRVARLVAQGMKWITSEWPTTRELFNLMDTSAFVGTNPTGELITSGFTVIGTRLRKASCGTPDPTVLHSMALMCLLRDTSDQLVQSRKQKLQDGRLVRLFVPEDKLDGRRVSLERTARYRASEKVLGVSR
jgi:hypothetical protein